MKAQALVLERESQSPAPRTAAGATPALPEELFLARVGVAVRVFRITKRHTQTKLAELAGLTHSTVQRIERGDTAGTIVTITAIERALQLRPGLLARLASP